MTPPSRPTHRPIGLTLSRTSKAVSQAFDEALAEAGGSLPVWLILLSLKTQRLGTQRELAAAVGIQSATLTHHLNAMEADGLLGRERDPDNRRVQRVTMTRAGEALFRRLATAAAAHDQRLRGDLSPDELAQLERLLDRLAANVAGPEDSG